MPIKNKLSSLEEFRKEVMIRKIRRIEMTRIAEMEETTTGII